LLFRKNGKPLICLIEAVAILAKLYILFLNFV